MMENKNSKFRKELAQSLKETNQTKNSQSNKDSSEKMMKKIGTNAKIALKIIKNGEGR